MLCSVPELSAGASGPLERSGVNQTAARHALHSRHAGTLQSWGEKSPERKQPVHATQPVQAPRSHARAARKPDAQDAALRRGGEGPQAEAGAQGGGRKAARVPCPRGQRLVEPPHRRRLRRHLLERDRAVPLPPDQAGLRVQHPGAGRMGHAVPAAHDGRHVVRGGRAGGTLLDGLHRGHAAAVPRQLRGAHLSGLRPRRDADLSGLPGQPRHHVRAHAARGMAVVPVPRI